MPFTIRAISSSSDTKIFIKSQFNFYKGDQNFVAPIMMDRMKLLNTKKNPFFKHSTMQLFLAEENGVVIGRIGAIINDNHNITHADLVGFFGFFECANRQDVADALFKNAADWLRERGMETMRGPANPSFNDEAGLLVDGFDSPPVILMTYNPPYYESLILNAGFAAVKDLYAYLLRNESYRSDKMNRLVGLLRERSGVVIRAMDFKNKTQFEKDVALLKNIYNIAWEKNWGFVKFTAEEFDFLAADLKQIADPNLVLIAEVKGKPAGFCLALPDVNQALVHNRNGSLLGALWNLWTRQKKITLARIIVLGLLPEFRKSGIDTIMYYDIADRALERGITMGEASWILDDNEEMNRALTQTMRAEKYKTYRVFDRKL